MKAVTVQVFRFDPEKDAESRFVSYTVKVNEGARVLHVLHAIHDELDPTLSYRYCCGSGQCGSCAVRVNGEPALACMEEVLDNMTIMPLNLPVKKDLVVDLIPKLAQIASLQPKETLVMPTKADIDAIKPLRDCIECLSCVSVCPAMDVTSFAGPTAMRQEERLALDPRNTSDRIPAAIAEGLFFCTTCQACLKVCPKKIETPGKAIEKLRSLANQRGFTLPRHQEVAALIRETGRSVPRTESTFLEQVGEVVEPAGTPKATVGFFVGCMYNLRLPKTALDALEVLKRNGIRVIIPKEQVCCGSPLIRTGQLAFVDTLKKRNIDTFRFRKIDTVMTMCAGCGSGGGVRSGNPDEAAALGKRRGDEIAKTNADVVISSCPFCEFHIVGHTDKPVKNLTTVLLEGYKEKDRKAGVVPGV